MGRFVHGEARRHAETMKVGTDEESELELGIMSEASWHNPRNCLGLFLCSGDYDTSAETNRL
jgi:hypothetical protein